MNLRSTLFITSCLLTLCVSTVMAQPHVYRVSLQEATELSIQNNFDIQLAKYEAWIARTGDDKAESIYDLIMRGSVGYRDDQSAVTSTVFGTKNEQNDYDVGVTQRLPTGTILSLDLTNNRSATNSSFATNSVTHDSTLLFSLKQDLGKNFFGVSDRGSVKTARIDISSLEYAALENIETQLAEVQKAYWDLVTAQKVIDIERDMLKEAKELFDLNEGKIKDGLIEKPELIASEANYRSRLNSLRLAQDSQQSAVARLRFLLNIEDKNVQLLAVDEYRLPESHESAELSMQLAFEQRRDYQIKKNEVLKRSIELEMNKANLWPEINLTATFARNGLGANFSRSVENITDQNNPELFVGLSVEMPLQNRSAEADLERSKYEDAHAVLDLKRIERHISVDVINRARNVNILKEVAKNSVEISGLQQQKFIEEMKRYNSGRSDTDTIIRFQEDVLISKRQAVTAKNNYHKATVELRKAEGSLLAVYGNDTL